MHAALTDPIRIRENPSFDNTYRITYAGV